MDHPKTRIRKCRRGQCRSCSLSPGPRSFGRARSFGGMRPRSESVSFRFGLGSSLRILAAGSLPFFRSLDLVGTLTPSIRWGSMVTTSESGFGPRVPSSFSHGEDPPQAAIRVSWSRFHHDRWHFGCRWLDARAGIPFAGWELPTPASRWWRWTAWSMRATGGWTGSRSTTEFLRYWWETIWS